MKEISVVIPCYNVASYIDRCMTSITMQTIGIEHLEIICIDDASNDGTWEHLQTWESLFPNNIILIRLEINGRQGRARNIGLQYTSAEWISFVDADDWLEPDYFEQLYRPVGSFECDVVSCGVETDSRDALAFFDEDFRGDKRNQYIVVDTEEKRKRLIVNMLAGSGAYGKIIRRQFLIDFEIFFPENLVYEDIGWRSVLHAYIRRIYVVEKNLYHYFINQNSTTFSRNADYYLDFITVQLMKHEEYDRRGILNRYREEFEHEYAADALLFIQIIIRRYDEPSFSLFQLEREVIRQLVPDYRSNKYIGEFSEFWRTILDLLYAPVDKKIFEQIVGLIKGEQVTINYLTVDLYYDVQCTAEICSDLRCEKQEMQTYPQRQVQYGNIIERFLSPSCPKVIDRLMDKTGIEFYFAEDKAPAPDCLYPYENLYVYESAVRASMVEVFQHPADVSLRTRVAASFDILEKAIRLYKDGRPSFELLKADVDVYLVGDKLYEKEGNIRNAANEEKEYDFLMQIWKTIGTEIRLGQLTDIVCQADRYFTQRNLEQYLNDVRNFKNFRFPYQSFYIRYWIYRLFSDMIAIPDYERAKENFLCVAATFCLVQAMALVAYTEKGALKREEYIHMFSNVNEQMENNKELRERCIIHLARSVCDR